MSTFGGKIKEIPYITVDRFNGEYWNSEVYFLSHCHTDHMIGLSDTLFWKHLEDHNKFLYASNISCKILAQMFPSSSEYTKELCIYTPTTIFLENKTLSVTTIPAGHCPGSIMFLFETNSKKILYTGDYRINKGDIRKLDVFYNSIKQVKIIDTIYLDTTFFSKSYREFPKRRDSLREVCRIIENHITHDRNFSVTISTGAKYGYEYVFKEIYNTFKMPVHVNEEVYNFYKLLPELDSSVTIDGSKTQIHCNCGGFGKMCDFSVDSKILELKLTAWIWNSKLLEKSISHYDSNRRIFCVCYSTHASLEEGMELIRFLKPKDVQICVESKKTEVNEEMNEIIKELLQEIHMDEKCDLKPKYFKINDRKKSPERITGEASCILDSPPREKRPLLHSSLSFEELGSPSKKIAGILSSSYNEVASFPKDKEKTLENCLDPRNKIQKQLFTSYSNSENTQEFFANLGKCENAVASCSNTFQLWEQQNAQSNQLSLDGLQISPYEEDNDVILTIIEENVNEIDNLFENCLEKIQKDKTSNFHNLDGDVILNVIGSHQKIVEDLRSSDPICDDPNNESQDILLDILGLKPEVKN